MIPLGITAPQRVQYEERLRENHAFAVNLDVLHLDEKPKGKLTGTFSDGQINLQRAPRGVSRSLTLTAYDPEHLLHLDATNPFEGAVFFDRMVRVRHVVEMPYGNVGAVGFCGPMTKIGRDGDILTIECQDKAVLAMEGRPPMKRPKGYNAVRAIKDFMGATGEKRFRFVVPKRKRGRRLPESFAISWTRSPWAVCQQIAKDVLNMQLVYAADGALLLRDFPGPGTIHLTHRYVDLVGGVRIDYSAEDVRNHVRVTGEIPVAKKAPPKAKPKPFTETATAKAKHPMSPPKLGRNGHPRYLPLVIKDTGIHKHTTAARRAREELARALPVTVVSSWQALPYFHLDTADRIKVVSDRGEFATPLLEASIPLGLGGDANYGRQIKVSKPRRSGSRTRT